MTTDEPTNQAGINPQALEYEQYRRREIALSLAVETWQDRTPVSNLPKEAVLDAAQGYLEFLNGA